MSAGNTVRWAYFKPDKQVDRWIFKILIFFDFQGYPLGLDDKADVKLLKYNESKLSALNNIVF